MGEMRFCVYCKHHRHIKDQHYDTHNCLRDYYKEREPEFNLITGEKINKDSLIYDCGDERHCFSMNGPDDRCGSYGKYFEPKENSHE